MPSFACASSVRIASHDHTLRLKTTHHLAHGPPSDIVHTVKGRLPKELDVLWLSDITVALSGSLDGRKIPAHDVARSGLARHFQMQMQSNTDRLGVNNVSHLFVDDADGLAKLTLTPARPLPQASRPHANLVALHLAYIWKTVAGRNDTVPCDSLVEEVDPFSPTLFLPTEALLNRVTEQFLIYHVVGRYPLIFGPWCKKLDLEMQCFPSIANSIVEIMARSKNHRFVSKCGRLIKIARGQHKFVIQTSSATLSSCTGDPTSDTSEEEIDNLSAAPVLTDEQVLCESLEQLFRIGVPQRRFKPAATPQFVPLPQDEDESWLLPMLEHKTDNEACWAELPEIAVPPCPLELVDAPHTVLEDMDTFTMEDWSEDEMWRLDDVNASAGGCEFTAQSAASLISGSISLASIGTRSHPACTFTHYPHQGVDYHGPNPADSGLRYKVSQLDLLEDPGTLTLCASTTPSESRALHGHHYSERYEQVTCQVDVGNFEKLDSSSESGEDSEWILFEENDRPASAEIMEELV